MKLLDGKNALVFGVANDHSIAWGIAQAMHEHGAQLAFSYASEPLERRVRPLAESVGSDFVELCDVADDHQIEVVFTKAVEKLGSIDILVHAVAYADREDLKGDFHMTSRSGFHLAMDISVYSFIALARAALPLMKPGSSMLTLSYYGGQKVVPNYNVMGVAKAALEATTRRKCHLCRTHPHPIRRRHERLQTNAPRILCIRPAAQEHHHRGHRRCGCLARLRHGEQGHRGGTVCRLRIQYSRNP
jgi:enoyl-[acyl-carrier-protein] reductase (NADH)